MQPTHPHNPTTAAGGSALRKTRRRRRRRGRNALQSLRVALVLAGGVATAYLLFALLNKAAHPYLLRYETRRQVRTARAELARQQRFEACHPERGCGDKERGGAAGNPLLGEDQRAIAAACNFMQRTAREAAAGESRIDLGDSERKHRFCAAASAFDLFDLRAQ